jgi:SAM-dependent methyltransferase
LDVTGLNCLDVGAGSTARDGIRLLEAGAASVTLVDVGVDWMSAANSEFKARRFEKGRYRLIDVDNWMFATAADRQFDFITCGGVLHHIEDPHATMRAVTRDLVPGGYFYLELMGKGGIVRNFVMHDLRDLYRSDKQFRRFMTLEPEEMVAQLVAGLVELAEDRDRRLPQREAQLLEALGGGIDVDLMLTLKDRVMSPIYTEYDLPMAENLLAEHGLHVVQRVFPTPQFGNIRSILEPVYAYPDRPLHRILMGSGNPHLLAQKPHTS